MKIQRIIPTLIISLFWYSNSQAQSVIADFSADKTTGCPPSLTVQFTNKSTGTGLTYAWDFGNSGGTSTEKDPKAVFLNPGYYTITLKVTNGTLSNTKTMAKYIQVYNPPTANFIANLTKGCTPLNTTFTDLSTKGDGNLSQWSWDYRNGTVSTLQNPPAVTYSSQGTYSVYLKVTDDNGCFGQVEKLAYIDAANKPTVSFTASPDKSCTVPQLVNFTNTSTGLGSFAYSWDFGNSTNSSNKSPSTTYNAFGIYTVKLTVSSTDYGCSSSLEYPAISLTQIDAAGTIQQNTTTIKSNDTICAGALTFTNQSSGTSNVYWNFGDGNYSYLSNTTHTYNTKGKYTISLIASTTGAKCTDTVKWIINVEKVTADFTYSPTSGCTSPILVNFTNQSSSASSYKWVFHDSTTNNQLNTSYTYTIPKDKDPYIIHTDQSYPIILNAYSPHGCVSKAIKYFTVNRPTALYSIDKSEGCAPLLVTFLDKSLPTDNISNRTWNFGDNAIQSASGASMTHTYTTPGVYSSSLIVTDLNSCKDTSYTITIRVGKKPRPDFTFAPSPSFYTDQLVTITDKTPASDNVNYWNYSINGVSISSNWDVPNPTFYYRTDTGKLSVRLLAGNNGCFEDTVFKDLVTCLGPISSFSYDMNCSTPLKYTFTGITKGTTSFEWDFGDNNKDNSNLTAEHTYSIAGDYLVKLITENNNHKDSTMAIIKVRIPKAIFTTKISTCINEAVSFNGQASHPYYSSCGDKYIWDFGDENPNLRTNNDSIYHTFTKRGEYSVVLTALYENGCTSSATQKIRVFAPYAKFKTDTTSGCDKLQVAFTDLSSSDGSTLTNWYWDFANGTDSSFTSGGHNFNKIFNLSTGLSSHTYPVVLSVTDANGCVGKDTVKINISRPSANFNASSLTHLCLYDTAKFIRSFTDTDSVLWYFGDGTTSRSNAIPVTHKYAKMGNYGLSLKIYKFHCTDSISKPIGYIQLQNANAKFTVSDSILNCQGEIKFKHTGIMSPVDSGTWSFGDRGNTGSYDTAKVYNYFLPGTFISKLRVYTSFGCADTFSRVLKVFSPYADMALQPRQACKGDTVTFELRDTANVFKWEWNFGEGIAYSNKNPVKYAFRSVGEKPISLVVYQHDGICRYTVDKTYVVEEVTAKIGVTDTSVCESEKITFTNLSVGQTIFNWNMGDGSTSAINNPQQTYASGIYKVMLTVANDNGCKDTAIQTMTIKPVPIISVTSDTTLCRGVTLSLQSSGGNIVNWYPNKWLSGANIYNPIATPDSTIKYYVNIMVDSIACNAKDSVLITIQQKPNFSLSPSRDTTIFIADELPLTINSAETYIYQWTPLTYLTCNTDCSVATVKPEDSITYFLTVKDVNDCFTSNKKIKITIKDTCTFNIANAFTPNGEEQNRILKVEGKGIKELIEFKIYNRWGNVVFVSNDLTKGWDGTTQGKIQPVDTYMYTITVLSFKGFVLSKKGSVLLIR